MNIGNLVPGGKPKTLRTRSPGGTAKLGIHGMYRWDIGSVSLGVTVIELPTPPTALSLEQIKACLPVEIELVSHWQAGFGGPGHIRCHEQSYTVLSSSREVLLRTACGAWPHR